MEKQAKRRSLWTRLALRIAYYVLVGPILGEALGAASDLIDLAFLADIADQG